MKQTLKQWARQLPELEKINAIYLLASQTQTIYCEHFPKIELNEELLRRAFLLLIVAAEKGNIRSIESQIESRIDSRIESSIESRIDLKIGSAIGSESKSRRSGSIEISPGKIFPWIIRQEIFDKPEKENLEFSRRIMDHAELVYSSPQWSRNPLKKEFAPGTESPSFRSECSTLVPLMVDEWLNRASEFLVSAQLFLIRKQLKMAAFSLHQSAEQAYSAIICRQTGFRPETHQLGKLHGFAIFFQPKLYSLFPPGLPKDECLLHFLQRAYVEARYSSHFHASAEKIEILCQRMSLLLNYASINTTVSRNDYSRLEPSLLKEPIIPYHRELSIQGSRLEPSLLKESIISYDRKLSLQVA